MLAMFNDKLSGLQPSLQPRPETQPHVSSIMLVLLIWTICLEFKKKTITLVSKACSIRCLTWLSLRLCVSYGQFKATWVNVDLNNKCSLNMGNCRGWEIYLSIIWHLTRCAIWLRELLLILNAPTLLKQTGLFFYTTAFNSNLQNSFAYKSQNVIHRY